MLMESILQPDGQLILMIVMVVMVVMVIAAKEAGASGGSMPQSATTICAAIVPKKKGSP